MATRVRNLRYPHGRVRQRTRVYHPLIRYTPLRTLRDPNSEPAPSPCVQCLNGKTFLFGYDAQGRPGLLDITGRESSPEGPGRVTAYVWMMERAIEIMPRGVE